MEFLNVALTGLRGRHHPALSNIVTTLEVRKSRPHLKMLSGDYSTYETKSIQSGGSPHCRCCSFRPSPNENLVHILTNCGAYSDIRNRMISEYKEISKKIKSDLQFEEILKTEKTFCQFILDPASFNLKFRVHMSDPILSTLFSISRDFCFSVNNRRLNILKESK